MKRVKIAVDGPAGSGKSSVAKEVAAALELQYVDSGAIYRAVTWYCLEHGIPVDPETDFGTYLQGLSIEQQYMPEGTCITSVNGKDVSGLIRNERITGNIGIISDSISVRNFVNDLLKKFALDHSLIMDGRDIGTVVFPDAEMKIFLDASVEVRAQRRIDEYREMGKKVDENLIKNQIILRDDQDRNRPFGALTQASDAHYIDTSDLTKQEVIDKLIRLIKPIL